MSNIAGPPKSSKPADQVGAVPSSFVDTPGADNGPNSTDTNLRYAAYFSRAKVILLATQRYVAYTSDIGESFRPVAHPRLVTAAYGISWTYLIGDVSYESWKARLRQQGLYEPGLKPWDPLPIRTEQEKQAQALHAPDWRLVGLERAVFQSIASMGLPAFTIHSTVKYASKALKDAKNPALRAYGPVALGLAVVPALPFLFDEPVEKAVEYVFHKGTEFYNGKTKLE
ncbi:hypothetical protein NADFUDRAFT_62942 [Nadsonia fulvescens var. elongata DSM 6958]|uniref:Mitochondrial fission process protein 1 n=1 Tax=Nadsonia fulvescens var. elongata DSM 6958 TaxID=857566 RepID=A0A1E3PD62_9ASCO|nr:hypothetical protein NADFUDRAFT_62942 [Nadsonia fulvescens var. elongata DSM 6958]